MCCPMHRGGFFGRAQEGRRLPEGDWSRVADVKLRGLRHEAMKLWSMSFVSPVAQRCLFFFRGGRVLFKLNQPKKKQDLIFVVIYLFSLPEFLDFSHFWGNHLVLKFGSFFLPIHSGSEKNKHMVQRRSFWCPFSIQLQKRVPTYKKDAPHPCHILG